MDSLFSASRPNSSVWPGIVLSEDGLEWSMSYVDSGREGWKTTFCLHIQEKTQNSAQTKTEKLE